MTNERSPEEWEASDHIENLKAGIPKPGSAIPGLCGHHPALALALIWIIRRMDKDDRISLVRVPLTSGGVAAVVIGIFEAIKQLL